MFAGVVDVFAFSVEDEYAVNTRNARAKLNCRARRVLY